jgi:hypothetical protein
MADLNARLSKELNETDAFASKAVLPYTGSTLQKATYECLQYKDRLYQQFITNTYGSYENFLNLSKINLDINVFDPTSDYIMDVTVIKKDTAFKTDHISAQEVILENLSGVCTVFFVKNDGSSRKITCTLESSAIPSGKQREDRLNFFRPLAGDRIGVWDLNSQSWKSFYMSRVFKFIRDDSQSIE